MLKHTVVTLEVSSLCVKIAETNMMRLQQVGTIVKNAGYGYALNVSQSVVYVQNVESKVKKGMEK